MCEFLSSSYSSLFLLCLSLVPIRIASHHGTFSQQVSIFESSLADLQRAQSSVEARVLESATQHAAATQALTALETRLITDLRAEMRAGAREAESITSSLLAEVRADARRAEVAATELHEQHAQALAQLTATVEALRETNDRRIDHTHTIDTLRSQVDALQEQSSSQGASLAALASASQSVSSLPQQLAALTISAEESSRSLAELAQHQSTEAASTTAAIKSHADSLQRLATRADETDARLAAANNRYAAKIADASEQFASQISDHRATVDAHAQSHSSRLSHLEDALRALPPPDTTTAPRVNHLYVQLDRLEQTVDAMAKSVQRNKHAAPATKNQSPVSTEAEEK